MFRSSLAVRVPVRCSFCVRAGDVTSSTTGSFSYAHQRFGYATTPSKPRARKILTVSDEAGSPSKVKLSTQATATGSANLSKKNLVDTTEAVLKSSSPPVSTAKTTRSASTKTTARTTVKKAAATSTPGVKESTNALNLDATPKTVNSNPAAARTVASASRFTKPSSVASPNPATPSAPSPGKQNEGAVPPTAGRPASRPEPPKYPPSSAEFKQASRNFTSLIVSIPILLVTSYFLIDRLAMGNDPKRPEFTRSSLETAASSQSK